MYNQLSEDPVDLVTSLVSSAVFHKAQALYALRVNTRSRRVKRRRRNPSEWICVSRSGGTRSVAAVCIRHCLLSALYSELKVIIIQGLLPRIVVYLSPLLPVSVSCFLPSLCDVSISGI